MRSLLLVMTFALGALSPTISAQDPPKTDKAPPKATPKTAKKFANLEGKYRIAFPDKPTLSDQKVPTVAGDLDMHMAVIEKDSAVYIVTWNLMPKGTKEVEPDKILDGTEKGVVADGKKISSKVLAYGPQKVPAREVVWDTKVGYRFRALVLLKDGKLYQVLFGGSKEKVDSDEAKVFINSLEFTDPEK